ncbi:MAG: hypothetical protein WCD66_01190 [Rhodanobacteraceae bacterium]
MRFATFMPRQSMHPVLRVLLILAGAGLMALLVVFSAAAMMMLLLTGSVTLAIQRWRARHGTRAASGQSSAGHEPQVLEGEFVVVDTTHPRR